MKKIYFKSCNLSYFFIFLFVILFYFSLFGQDITDTGKTIQSNNFNLLEDEYDRETELQKSEYKPRFGLFAGYGLNYYHTNFKELPGYPNCCNLFQRGAGNGFNFGGLVQLKLTAQWHLGASFGYSNLNGLLKSTATEPIFANGELQTATIDNVLDCAINTITLAPYIAYNIPGAADLFVTAGLNVGIIAKANFTQYEHLVSPNFGTFENGYRIRNNITADLPQQNILFAGSIGIKYEIPFNNNRNVRLAPEVKYHYWATSPVGSLNWSTSQITLGVSILYNKPPIPPELEEPLPPPLPDLPLPHSQLVFAADITHQINSSAEQTDIGNILVEDFTHTNFKPLLNYIFFDENSATIPARYKQMDNDTLLLNEYRNFAGLNSLETYYYLLDIIGLRLTKYPNSNIELVGTNSNKGVEKNNVTLSQARADQVKQYFVTKWKIPPHRIKSTARNLPKEPTNPVDASGDEENMRVEIYSSDRRITDPITSFDTMSVIKTPSITFMPKVQSSLGIAGSKLIISQNKNNTNQQKTVELDSKLSSLTIDFNDVAFKNYLAGQALYYTLEVQDKIGQTVSSAKKQINIDRITVASKRENTLSDTDYEYYSLILFNFAAHSLDAKHNEVVNYIRTRIKDNSKVVVTGYTDIIGQPEVNKRIATERATATAKRLKIANVEIKGVGADELLYSNEFPEGRFYCRTVTIAIETPIKN